MGASVERCEEVVLASSVSVSMTGTFGLESKVSEERAARISAESEGVQLTCRGDETFFWMLEKESKFL